MRQQVDIGIRMKEHYEDRTRYTLPRRTYTIVRLDGKAFHTFTDQMKFEKPFSATFMKFMDDAAIFLCEKIQGARFAFNQSDEISMLLTDFNKPGTSAWFDGNIQKIASVSASLVTGKFNELILSTGRNNSLAASAGTVPLAFFDARVFTIPDPVEVSNYFIWRQQDATRNSIQSVAQSLYSLKDLHGKGCSELQEMIHQKGVNWNDYPPACKRGRIMLKSTYKEGEQDRTKWFACNTPVFTQNRKFLEDLIPLYNTWENEPANDEAENSKKEKRDE